MNIIQRDLMPGSRLWELVVSPTARSDAGQPSLGTCGISYIAGHAQMGY